MLRDYEINRNKQNFKELIEDQLLVKLPPKKNKYLIHQKIRQDLTLEDDLNATTIHYPQASLQHDRTTMQYVQDQSDLKLERTKFPTVDNVNAGSIVAESPIRETIYFKNWNQYQEQQTSDGRIKNSSLLAPIENKNNVTISTRVSPRDSSLQSSTIDQERRRKAILSKCVSGMSTPRGPYKVPKPSKVEFPSIFKSINKQQ